MGVAIRQSILTSLISYAGVVVGYISLLYLYPKFLTPDQVGLLRTIQDAAMLMVPFATMGLAQAVLRYFPQYSTEQQTQRAFVGLMLLFALAGFLLFAAVFYAFENEILAFFEENASDVIHYKNLIVGLIFLLLFLTLFEQLSKSILHVAFPNFLRDIVIRILQAVLVTLYYFNVFDFRQFITGSVLIYVLTLSMLVIYLARNSVAASFKGLHIFSFKKIKEILQYSSLSFIGLSAMILIGKIDSIMVSGMLGLADVAIYTTAFYMATVIEIPKRAITTATTTLLARSFEKSNLPEVETLYKKTSLHQLIIGSLLFIGVWSNLDNIFLLMPNGSIYSTGGKVIILVGLAKLFDMTFGPSSEIISLSPYYRFNIICIAVLAAVVITCNYFFIPVFGINGAAYSSVLALVGYNVIKYIFIYVRLNMQPFTRHTLTVSAISLVVALTNVVLPKVDNVVIDIAYRSSVITALFSLLIISSKCSDEINEMFSRVVTKIKSWMND
jgi:O-antigen/teichoic acid export membrane protein